MLDSYTTGEFGSFFFKPHPDDSRRPIITKLQFLYAVIVFHENFSAQTRWGIFLFHVIMVKSFFPNFQQC